MDIERSRLQYLWRVPLANLAAIVPPLGLIGFISPVSGRRLSVSRHGLDRFDRSDSAAWYRSLHLITRRNAVVPASASCLHSRPRSRWASDLIVLIARTSKPPASWEAVNTNFGDLSRPYQEFVGRCSQYNERVAASPARVLVFPESVVPRWSDATDELLAADAR